MASNVLPFSEFPHQVNRKVMWFASLYSFLQIGQRDDDAPELKNSKQILVLLAFCMAIGGLVWGSICLYFGFYGASLIPYGYVVATGLNLFYFTNTKDYRSVRFIQLLLSLLLPFAFQWLLGGFESTGIVMLWATVALVGTMILYQGFWAYLWLLFFLGLTAFSVYVDPIIQHLKPVLITESVSRVLLLMNLSFNFSILFVLGKTKIEEDIKLKNQLRKAYRRVQSLNEANETQNEELRQLTEEISSQRDFIQEKNTLLERQNRKMNQSIQVGQRIQRAILPPTNELAYCFESCFVIYQPLDVVSGDLYWCHQNRDMTLVALVDCTGHGVPGAFMSLIASMLLNEVVAHRGIHDPAEILNYLHREIPKRLRQSRHESNEGMDISLSRFSHSEGNVKEVTFAGAKLPFCYYQDGSIREVKGDHQHIGGFLQSQEPGYTNRTIHLRRGDMVYLYTDGLLDIPNPRRKKFGKKRLHRTLQAIVDQPLSQQREMVMRETRLYSQDSEHRDDITLLAFRL